MVCTYLVNVILLPLNPRLRPLTEFLYSMLSKYPKPLLFITLKPHKFSICFHRCTLSASSWVTSFRAVLKMSKIIWANSMGVSWLSLMVIIDYLASTILRSTSSIDLPCVDTNAPTRLDRFFFSFSHWNIKAKKSVVMWMSHMILLNKSISKKAMIILSTELPNVLHSEFDEALIGERSKPRNTILLVFSSSSWIIDFLEIFCKSQIYYTNLEKKLLIA